MKIVINGDYGEFGLSENAIERYFKLKGWKLVKAKESDILMDSYYTNSISDDNYWSYYYLERDDPTLVQVVEELHEVADGRFSELKIVEIPDDVDWTIEEYDGVEWIAEKHRTWE